MIDKKETANYLLGKIPDRYISYIDRREKFLILDIEETDDSFFDTKVKYWVFNLEINHNYKIRYGPNQE